LRAEATGAHAGVVPAIKQAVGAVPFGIIEQTPRFAMLAGGHRLAGMQTGRPCAVMRLKV
jgi:hypothetical protein